MPIVGHDIIHANPHSIRGVAASWAEIAREPASEICCAATSGHPCVCLPNTIIWTLLKSPLAPMSLTWLCKDDRDKANAETPFPSRVLLYLAFDISFGCGFFTSYGYPHGFLVKKRNEVLEEWAFPL